MFKPVWRIESSTWIAEILIVVLAAVLGSIGFGLHSPIFQVLAMIAASALIYRLRYKRF